MVEAPSRGGAEAFLRVLADVRVPHAHLQTQTQTPWRKLRPFHVQILVLTLSSS